MKTPEEIKKGLEYCTSHVQCDSDCEYYSCSHEYGCPVRADALAYIQQLEAQVPKWISVEERLPENDANYLVFTSDANRVELAIYYGDGEWLAQDFGNLTRVVTHWMPLPSTEEINNDT